MGTTVGWSDNLSSYDKKNLIFIKVTAAWWDENSSFLHETYIPIPTSTPLLSTLLHIVRDTLLSALARNVGTGCKLWGAELSNMDIFPEDTVLVLIVGFREAYFRCSSIDKLMERPKWLWIDEFTFHKVVCSHFNIKDSVVVQWGTYLAACKI